MSRLALVVGLQRIGGCAAVTGLLLLAGAHAQGQTQRQLFGYTNEMLPPHSGRALAVGDVDGDLDADIVAASNDQTLLFLHGEYGVFTDVTDSHMPDDSDATALSMGDVDGDGDLDIIVGAAQVRLYLNDGTGVFDDVTATHIPVDTGHTSSLAVGDVDGDADLDIVVGRGGGPGTQNRLYMNAGNGVYEDATATNLPVALDGTRALAMGDLDGDGDSDLVIGNDGQNLLYLNDGSGVFTDESTTHMPVESDYSLALALSDLDGDRDPDLIVGNHGSHGGQQNRLYLNDGSGVFVDATPTHMPINVDRTYTVALGDIDDDGDPDLVLGNWLQQNRVYTNDGTGVFTDMTTTNLPVDSHETHAVALADVDQDGDPDIIIENADRSFLYLNNSYGEFFNATAIRMTSHLHNGSTSTGLGDVDGDGDSDVVFGTIGLPHSLLYLNDGHGYFTDATSTHMPAVFNMTTALAVSDVDTDGDPDIVFASADLAWGGGYPNMLYLNDGNGVFDDATATHLPDDDPWNSRTWAVAVGDVDVDGDPDIVFGNSTGYRTSGQNKLYLNDGSGAFTDTTTTHMPIGYDDTISVALGDVDGDYDLDLVAGNGGGQNRLYFNDGSGVFTDVTSSHMPVVLDSTGSLVLGDVDGDTDLDLVVGNEWPGGQQIRLYLNNGSGTFRDATDAYLPTVLGSVRTLALSDVDDDLDLDIITGGYFEPIKVYLNNGGGHFDGSVVRSMPSYSPGRTALALGDVDGDTDPDIVIGVDGLMGTGVNCLLTNITRQVAWRGIPRVGKPLTMDVYGPAHTPWVLYVSASPTPPGASHGLSASVPWKVMASGFLDGRGRAFYTMPVPDDPALIDTSWYWRAEVDGVRTNMEVTTFTGL